MLPVYLMCSVCHLKFYMVFEYYLIFLSVKGQNIPEISRSDDIPKWLSDDGYKRLITKQEKLPKHVHRYFSDAYLCFYRNCVENE